ncbi:hypothetical protein [Sphingomonas solaris]|uniref:UrcA family protein n=1 Tax=Alterirhizorhabdus solaris TaxID=2529389 RepID=A0A558QVD0_9SPHN|nr:hypothetical protein [Sphingomonas solaris]TVV71027.1 hypothetical protein FOY91_17755 [Sphingomonas solaris]
MLAKTICAAMLASAVVAPPVLASAQAPGVESARQIIAERLSADLSPKQIGVLNIVAHATASAIICPRINMNDEAIKGALTAVINEQLPDLKSEADRSAFRDRTLVGFGALVGLMVDEAAPKKAAFCTAAEAEMREEGTRSFVRPAPSPAK